MSDAQNVYSGQPREARWVWVVPTRTVFKNDASWSSNVRSSYFVVAWNRDGYSRWFGSEHSPTTSCIFGLLFTFKKKPTAPTSSHHRVFGATAATADFLNAWLDGGFSFMRKSSEDSGRLSISDYVKVGSNFAGPGNHWWNAVTLSTKIAAKRFA